MKFPNGLLAQLATGVRMELEKYVRIIGSEGRILVPSPWSASREAGFSKIILFRDDIPEEIIVEADRDMYAIEADTVAEHIERRQAPVMGWEDSLGNMKALDRWRAAVGMKYEFEQ